MCVLRLLTALRFLRWHIITAASGQLESKQTHTSAVRSLERCRFNWSTVLSGGQNQHNTTELIQILTPVCACVCLEWRPRDTPVETVPWTTERQKRKWWRQARTAATAAHRCVCVCFILQNSINCYCYYWQSLKLFRISDLWKPVFERV